MKEPRGKYIAERVSGAPADAAEHYIRCAQCGAWFDMLDLNQVLDHNGPLPHPSADRKP